MPDDEFDEDDIDYEEWDDAVILESVLCPGCSEVTLRGDPGDTVECPNCGAVVQLKG